MSHGLDLSKAYADSLAQTRRAELAKDLSAYWSVARITYLEPPRDLSLAALDEAIAMLGPSNDYAALACGPGCEDVLAEIHLTNRLNSMVAVVPAQMLVQPGAWALLGAKRIIMSLP